MRQERDGFCMSGHEEAKELLAAAIKDLRALKGMTDAEEFAEERFGFHAQQAVEKTLKAWIASFDKEYPLKHDLRLLLIQLEDIRCDVKDLWDFVDLNAFAVQLRYAGYVSSEASLDRHEMINKIQTLYDRVKNIIDEKGH